MAKAKPKPEPTDADLTNDRALAERAIRAVTGCGVPESRHRVTAMTDAQVKKIAAAERSKKRDQVPGLLSADKKPTSSTETS